jgi:hypothetical protein
MLRRKTHKLIKYFKEKKNNDTPTDQHTNWPTILIALWKINKSHRNNQKSGKGI